MDDEQKRKIDELLKRQEREKAKKREEEENVRSALAKRERERKFEQLGRSFRCHICKKPSVKPATTSYTTIETNESDRPIGSYETISEDFSKPGDMWRCNNCGKWACSEHIYRGICTAHVEKM